MPGLDGFAVLKKVLALDGPRPPPQVVFATAFDQYAVKAFEVNAVDYLLKPFDTRRVVKTLEKVRARRRDALAAEANPDASPATTASPTAVPEGTALPDPDAPATAPPTRAAALAGRVAGAEAKLDALLRMMERQAQSFSRAGAAAARDTAADPATARTGKLVVRANGRLLLVDQKDVCFASIEDGRISVVTRTLEGDSTVRTLEELSDQLDPGAFWRAHRSFLVNIQHIREVVPWFKSSYQLRMDDRQSTEIPVSRTQTRRLRELFNL